MAIVEHRTTVVAEDSSATNSIENDESSPTKGKANGAAPQQSAKFWAIMFALILAAVISALDGSVVSTALPTIVRTFHIDAGYVWVVNIFFLTMAVVQPVLGQISNLWGRRWVFITTVAVFVLGSGIIGGASSATMLIAGRGVQGLGAGGINMMMELIISDLLPLRERGSYLGMTFAVSSSVSAAGPVISGALAEAGKWRWIWYMNLPIGGVCLVAAFIWLRLKQAATTKSSLQRLAAIDWVGSAIIVASTTAILWAIAYGGATKPWSDGGVIAALVAGHVGLILFVVWQGMPQCRNPITPLRLFGNRTSAIGFFLAFSNCLIIYWPLFMLPLYFQAVRGASPRQSGVKLLPFIVFFPISAMLGGGLMQKTGRYKPFHIIGFAFCALSFGLCSMLDEHSNRALWVVFQIFGSIGIGLPIACFLAPVQAPLPDSDTAVGMAAFAFVRSFGSIWGLAIPAAVFNNRCSQLLHTIEDPAARAALSNGKAYEFASAAFSSQFSSATRAQVISVYTAGLQRSWQIAVIFAGVPLLLSLFEKEIPLREELETDFGLEDHGNKTGSEDQAEKAEKTEKA